MCEERSRKWAKWLVIEVGVTVGGRAFDLPANDFLRSQAGRSRD